MRRRWLPQALSTARSASAGADGAAGEHGCDTGELLFVR